MTKKATTSLDNKMLLAILGVSSVGISGDKKLDFDKCYPMLTIVLIKKRSITLGCQSFCQGNPTVQKQVMMGFSV